VKTYFRGQLARIKLKNRKHSPANKGVDQIGIYGNDKIMAYKVGRFVFVFVKLYIHSSVSPEGFYYMKKAIREQIKEIIPDYETRIYIRESTGHEKYTRAILPICKKVSDPLKAFIEEDFRKAETFLSLT